MKYVILGDEDTFQYLGIRTASFKKKDTSEMSCKLEGGYILNIYGNDLCEIFTEFLKSNESVAVLMESDYNDSIDAASWLELLDVDGTAVYRY